MVRDGVVDPVSWRYLRLTRKRLISTSSLRYWIDASVLGLADGAPIGPWNDLSTSGVNVTAAVGSRPLFDNTPGQNGLGFAFFDGGDDQLTVADPDPLDFGTADVITWFVVGQMPTAGTIGQYFLRKKGGTSAATAGWSMRITAANLMTALYSDGTTQATAQDPTPNDGQWHVWMFHLDSRPGADGFSIWRDGTAVDTASTVSITGSSSNSDALFVGDGGAGGVTMSIGEARIYSNLPFAEYDAITQALMTKWGISAGGAFSPVDPFMMAGFFGG